MSDNNQIIKVVGNNLTFAGKIYHCAVGKNGFSDDKKEGDGCTPFGVFPLRELWYRADKIEKPKTNLPIKIITQNDGWCDDIASSDYNKHVKLPKNSLEIMKDCHPALVAGSGDKNNVGICDPRPRNKCGVTSKNEIVFSHEKLWREDDVYDIIIPIGYNDSPVVSGKGSAIFIHIARENYEPTEGCVALKLPDLLEILPFLSSRTVIEIKI